MIVCGCGADTWWWWSSVFNEVCGDDVFLMITKCAHSVGSNMHVRILL